MFACAHTGYLFIDRLARALNRCRWKPQDSLSLHPKSSYCRDSGLRAALGRLSTSMLREFGPLITAIIIAGRSGSAYAAQIGTMEVTEELDAMRTLGIEPMEQLVLPKIIALLVALPLLTVFADFLGVFGHAHGESAARSIRRHACSRRSSLPLSRTGARSARSC
jgi:hypothetical protein